MEKEYKKVVSTTEIKQTLAESKSKNLGKIKIIMIALNIIFLAILLIKIIFFNDNEGAIIAYLMIYVLLFIITYFTYFSAREMDKTRIHKYMKHYNIEYKKLLFKEVVKDYYKNVTFHNDKYINIETVKDSNLFEVNNKDIEIEGYDYFSGYYKDYLFEYSNININEFIAATINTEEVIIQIFDGKWMNFYMNKKFKNNIKIYYKKYQFINTIKNNKKIDIKNEEFNACYNLFSNVENESTSIISDKTLNKINELNNVIDENIIISFEDNIVQIGIDSNKDIEDGLDISVNGTLEKTKSKLENNFKIINELIEVISDDKQLF